MAGVSNLNSFLPSSFFNYEGRCVGAQGASASRRPPASEAAVGGLCTPILRCVASLPQVEEVYNTRKRMAMTQRDASWYFSDPVRS